MKKPPKRVLIVKLAAIGDTCMATPIAGSLRTEFPGTKIDWLVNSWAKDVLVNNPDIDEIVEFTPPGQAKGLLKKLNAYISALFLIYRLRGKHYDRAFIVHRSKFPGLLAKLGGVKEIIGFKYKDSGKYLTHGIKYDDAAHEVSRNLALLSAIDTSSITTEMGVAISADERKWADDLFVKLSFTDDKKIIAISPGGGDNPGLSMHTKRWDRDKFVELIKRLNNRANVLLVGGRDDTDVCAYIADKTGAKNMAGNTTLRQSMAILQRCDLYIGNDSGPLYIAAALGVKTVSLFGPSDPRLVAPIGEKHRYLWEAGTLLDCAPCYKPSTVFDTDFTQCPKGDFKCMNLNSVEAVLDNISHLLGDKY